MKVLDMDYSKFPQSRKEAKKKGEKYYYTDKPCVHGHTVPRQTVSGKCYQCDIQLVYIWREKNRDKIRVQDREYYANNENRRAQKRAIDKARKAGLREQYNSLNEQERAAVTYVYADCANLGSEYHVDHIVPLSKGGKHELSNLQIAPAEYNLSKGNSVYNCTKVTLQDHDINSVPAF